MNASRSRIERLLLALAATGVTSALLCAAGWFFSARETIGFENLSQADRQRLVESFFETTGRAYSHAWFEPELAYTLNQGQVLSVWGDTFRTNELGYRAPAAQKEPGVFRILLVGDSWTYGMGVSEQEAFPAQLAALANEMLPADRPRVEAWSLALPGYNTLNEIRALEIFFDRLDPDAVVLCPTRNDNDSNFAVMPSGTSRTRAGGFTDRFGDDIARVYKFRFLASHRWSQRWRKAFARIRDAETWLGQRKVPFQIFFVAYWEAPVVHDLIGTAGIQAPYAIAPKEAVKGRWRGTTRWRHGTPAAYRLFARMLYRGLARQLTWPALPNDPELDPLSAQFFTEPPPEDWRQVSSDLLRENSLRVETRFEPGEFSAAPCLGEIDCENGLMGRKAAILLRRKKAARRVVVVVKPLAEPSHLYPLELTASIPTTSGGTRVSTRVGGSGNHRFVLELPSESEVAPGEILEVELRAAGTILARDSFALRSLSVVSLEQER